MARRDKRPGAGVAPGSAEPETCESAERPVAEGITPLEVMLETMRFFHAEAARLAAHAADRPDKAAEVQKAIMAARHAAQDAAKSVALYIHPRLSSVEGETDRTVRYVASVPETTPDSGSWKQQHAPRPMPNERSGGPRTGRRRP